jgi:hypothetical protein
VLWLPLFSSFLFHIIPREFCDKKGFVKKP